MRTKPLGNVKKWGIFERIIYLNKEFFEELPLGAIPEAYR
jgi:hypothetical protein